MTPTQLLPEITSISYEVYEKPPMPHRPFSDPNLLAPEDAFYTHSAQHEQRHAEAFTGLDSEPATAEGGLSRAASRPRRRREKDRGRSGSRLRRGVWKKLLWVKQKDCKIFDRAVWHLPH